MCTFVYNRFIHKEDIDRPVLILVVGVLGLLVNLVGLCIFRRKWDWSVILFY